MSRPQIFIVDNSTSVTGAYKSIHSACATLKDKFDFTLIHGRCAPHNDENELRRFSIPFLEIRTGPSLLMYLPMLLINSIRITRLLSNDGLQIVHVNDLYNMCGIVVKILRPKIKLIYHIRLLPNSYVGSMYKIWRRLILRFADEVICVSEAVANHWPKRDNIRVIHDAIKVDKQHPVRRMELGTTIHFLYLANYIKGKGHELALRAFASVYKLNRNVRLKIVGGDMGLKKNLSYKNELIQMSQSLDIENVVSFENFSNDVEWLMQNADIFLNLSESESFSMTCLEALYYGTPCIATDSGGPAEIIVNNESGFIVPVGNKEAIIDAILKLMADAELRNKFSLAGQKRVRELFNAEIQAKYLERIYLE